MTLDLNWDQPAYLSSPGKERKLDLFTSTPSKNGEDSGQLLTATRAPRVPK